MTFQFNHIILSNHHTIGFHQLTERALLIGNDWLNTDTNDGMNDWGLNICHF